MSKKYTGVTPLNKGNTAWQYRIKITLPNGDKELKNITLADLQNYLHELYFIGDEYKGGYEYAYVEGFLRFFYLLFGYAYRLDKIEYERYIKMFVDRGTRLTMPTNDRQRTKRINQLKHTPTKK